MFRFLRRENLVKQSQQSISCPAINTPEKHGARQSDSSSDTDGELAEVSRKQRMFARKSIRRDRKKQKEQQKKIENNMISMDDFLSKQTEFKMWLKEEKQKTAADVKSPKLKTYFKDFMKMWNKKKLPQKYYRGTSGTETPPPSRNQRFTFVEGSPFPDLSGFPQPIDLSLEGVLLDSPFSTFGKAPGDPLTPNSTPRILKLPDIKPDYADKENSCELPNLAVKKLKEPSSDKKKKKNKSSTPKKSKMKNDNPYKVTVLTWTSKGELSVHPASPSSIGKSAQRTTSAGQLNTSVPYQEVKDAAPLEISDYDPLYADPDPLFNANTSVSRSKSLDTGLTVESPRTAATEGCKSVEELYAVPVKKKRMSFEKRDMTEIFEKMTSPPPPLPPKRKSPLEAWPYQSVVFDGRGAGPVCSMKKDTDEDDEFPSPPPPGQGFKMFRESVMSPACSESPMRMAVSMPDLCESNAMDSEVDSSSSSSSDSSSTSSSDNESEEKFEVKVENLDPDVQKFLDGDMSLPPPPPKHERMSDFCPQIRLSLLPPPPPELLMDTPPDDEDECRVHSEAYSSRSSMITEQGTPRSSRMLEDDHVASLSKCNTPKSVLGDINEAVETPPPTLVPIHTPVLTKPSALSRVTLMKEEAIESRRVSVGPVLLPPPPANLPKTVEPSSNSTLSGSETSTGSSKDEEGPNHDYLTDALTDVDTSIDKDEVFSYRQALSGAMNSLKSAYASSMEDITADVPKRRQDVKESSHLCTEDVLNLRPTPMHDARNRHHSENSAVKLQKGPSKGSDSSGDESKFTRLQPIKETATESKTITEKKKPPVLKPKPSKSKVSEAVEQARQRQSSSDRSSVCSTSSHSSVTSVSSNNSSVSSSSNHPKPSNFVLNNTSLSSSSIHPPKLSNSVSSNSSSYSSDENQQVQRSPKAAPRVLGQLQQNILSRPATPPKKPPRTPSSATKRDNVSQQCRTPPLTPTRHKVKGILKMTPTKEAPVASPSRQRLPCSKSVLQSRPTQSDRCPPSQDGVFETDIDSVLEDNSENTDPNCESRGVRETDLDKILAEMQSSYLLSPLMAADNSTEIL